MWKKKQQPVQTNPVGTFAKSVGVVVAAHYAIQGINNVFGWVAERAVTWRANSELKKQDQIVALHREASERGSNEDAEQAVMEFAQAFCEETQDTRNFLESFAKANGVVNAHSMKFETLVKRCQELREGQQAPATAGA